MKIEMYFSWMLQLFFLVQYYLGEKGDIIRDAVWVHASVVLW